MFFFFQGVSYWAIGWAIAYGNSENGFIGTSQFFSYKMDHSNYPLWFFQFVFAATAATIVSGSIAERCCFNAYFIYSIIITGKLCAVCWQLAVLPMAICQMVIPNGLLAISHLAIRLLAIEHLAIKLMAI